MSYDSITATGSRLTPTTYRYALAYPATPGAAQVIWSGHMTLAEVEQEIVTLGLRHRRDLAYQDVRIERGDGSLVRYAGPIR